MTNTFLKNLRRIAIATCFLTAATAATAAPYFYVDWLTGNALAGTAYGEITLPDSSKVNVEFKATYADGSAGSLAFVKFDGTTPNYWNPTTPYISAQVDNAPPSTDILALNGGQNQIYTVTLSQAIKDPIMAIVSLGQPALFTTYDFDTPFEIVSQGAGYWGGSNTSLVKLPGDVLQGKEGSGTIQFIGTYSKFSWTAPSPEYWHGFTFGIRTTEALEVPEPATLLLFGAGLFGLAVSRRRKI